MGEYRAEAGHKIYWCFLTACSTEKNWQLTEAGLGPSQLASVALGVHCME